MFTTTNIISVLFIDFTFATATSALLVAGSDMDLELDVDQLVNPLDNIEFDLHKYIPQQKVPIRRNRLLFFDMTRTTIFRSRGNIFN
jgi:hypothetical protein